MPCDDEDLGPSQAAWAARAPRLWRTVLDDLIKRGKATSISLLIAVGIREDGQKVLLDWKRRRHRRLPAKGNSRCSSSIRRISATGLSTPPGQVIDAAQADVQRRRLLGNRQIVLTVDHTLSLSKPALPSAPSKKSLSLA
jgi:hypothetical protein